ncbi:MAG: DUF4266 domain-containing protein [Gammaproteobacteria bacterium]|nr:DUF4266 domain-containing protein [Gammaproteobacteria bacterium]
MKISLLLITLGALSLSGCAAIYTPVKPWERKWLSQPGMLIGEADLRAAMDSHFYFSKEGTSGGNGFTGGGCGCN